MISPYQKFFEDYKGTFTLDVFITLEGSKKAQRLNFTEEEFEQIVDVLVDLFPPKEDGETFSFNVDADCDYSITPLDK